MNYILNPLPCAVLCDPVHSDGYKGNKKRDMLKWIFQFHLKKNPHFESWSLKLTHSCQQLLGVWMNATRVPPSSHKPGCTLSDPPPALTPKKKTQTPNSIRTRKLGLECHFGFAHAGVCAFTSLTDSLNFYHLVFALIITNKVMTPECVKCNTDHHGG